MSKYHSMPTVIDGIRFDSKVESHRYQLLRHMENVGEIADLKCHPRFLLQEAFKYNGKIERAVYYEADFSFTDHENIFVEDVKGVKTEVYKLKRKLFIKKYPNIIFKEIGA
jgi:hypothetical protein